MSEEKAKSVIESTVLKIAVGNAHSENQSDLGVTQSFDRVRYDDAYKRAKYKEGIFDGEKTVQDHYTEVSLHRNPSAARNKYGNECYTKHISDVDHVVPVKTVHEALRSNPFLTDSDVREIANIEENYRLTSSNFNRSKSDDGNLNIVISGKREYGTSTKTKMIILLKKI